MNFSIYSSFIELGVMMGYLSVKQTAQKWGISTKRVQYICKQGRIPGAFIIGNSWAIPDDAEKPKDARIKSGRYIKRECIIATKGDNHG